MDWVRFTNPTGLVTHCAGIWVSLTHRANPFRKLIRLVKAIDDIFTQSMVCRIIIGLFASPLKPLTQQTKFLAFLNGLALI
jgi:hypothetical protein